ncbi:hypothetical protein H6G45_04275 [Synechocystis sp. FACHB-383]|uniref:hypothetical protein n=1 Tax=Synechocystis sp. FACHB-383 TaxID=2692864 RepID=UPI001685298E|nr:hypothetical protein [Synechocystis sp. FACHB-383]MBD2652725.1 hypothetical protein [Synechocystis sp. FACHB-383]
MQVLYQLSYSPESQYFIVLKVVPIVKLFAKIIIAPLSPLRVNGDRQGDFYPPGWD